MNRLERDKAAGKRSLELIKQAERKKENPLSLIDFIVKEYPELITNYEMSLIDPASLKVGQWVKTIRSGFSGPAGVLRIIKENPYKSDFPNHSVSILLVDPNKPENNGLSRYDNIHNDFILIDKNSYY